MISLYLYPTLPTLSRDVIALRPKMTPSTPLALSPWSLEPGSNPSLGTHVQRMFHPWLLMTFISLFLVPSWLISVSKIDIKLKKSVLDTSIHLPEQAFMFVQSSQMFVNIETQHKSLHWTVFDVCGDGSKWEKVCVWLCMLPHFCEFVFSSPHNFFSGMFFGFTRLTSFAAASVKIYPG